MTVSPRKRADARAVADIFKCAVAAIAKQPVAASGHGFVRRKRTSLDGVDVQPPISIVVEQSNPPAHRFGGRNITRGMPVVLNETQAGISASSANAGKVSECFSRGRARGPTTCGGRSPIKEASFRCDGFASAAVSSGGQSGKAAA